MVHVCYRFEKFEKSGKCRIRMKIRIWNSGKKILLKFFFFDCEQFLTNIHKVGLVWSVTLLPIHRISKNTKFQIFIVAESEKYVSWAQRGQPLLRHKINVNFVIKTVHRWKNFLKETCFTRNICKYRFEKIFFSFDF